MLRQVAPALARGSGTGAMNTLIDAAVTLAQQQHLEGVRLYGEGCFEVAARMLEAAFRQRPSTELANDWGAAELACGRAETAEQIGRASCREECRSRWSPYH